MKLQFLGTGTSTGIPQIGCDCAVCRSSDTRDRRLRCSALLSTDCGRGVLIDCGPDFRTQILRAGQPSIDALLLTHIHYDHVGGIDDLRPYSYGCGDEGFPVFCRSDVAAGLRRQLPYAFLDEPVAGVPRLALHEVADGERFNIFGLEIEPLEVMHTPTLPILGYRIGPMAYITDCKTMPAATLRRLKGVDTLVINALRHKPHPSHQTLDDALAIIAEVKPRRALLTHLSHDMGFHGETSLILPPDVAIATDGLTIDI